MSYLPLARKYRPGKFKDLVGQEAVSLALSNGIRIGRAPAAVMFSGIRGIGKTTTARIYARALNCSQPEDVEPCGACDSCLSIDRGSHEDVVEVDGASHNGVDEVRSLKETVQYLPQRSRYKVYIIDEVHMLSVNAFNALLKTLEEPPPRVVFIFATTELQKVPQTITGRCQTFFLKKMTLADTQSRLREILNAEGISCDEPSLHLIARQGHGSMRDALTFLDQAIALGAGDLSYGNLAPLVSGLSAELSFELLKALVKRDPLTCTRVISRMDECGQDYGDAAADLARVARAGFIFQGLGQKESSHLLRDMSGQELQDLSGLVEEAPPLDLNRLFRVFIRCRQDLDGGDLDRYIFENHCLEWCLDPGLPGIGELLKGQFPGKDDGPKVSSPAPAPSGLPAHQPKSQAGTPRTPLTQRFKEELGEKVKPQLSPPAKTQAAPHYAEPSDSEEKKKPALSTHDFPRDWAGLVACLVNDSPFEGRVLEEAAPEQYGPELISIRVAKNSMADTRLREKNFEDKVLTYLRSRFGFRGQFRVIQDGGEAASGPSQGLGGSVLHHREQEKIRQKCGWEENARNHPLTLAITQALRSPPPEIRLKDDL